MSDRARTDASADAEFDRLQALYDALYSLLTPEQRTTFFGALAPPREPARPVTDPKRVPESEETARHVLFAMEDDLRRVGRLIDAIIVASRGSEFADDAKAIEEVAIVADQAWRRVHDQWNTALKLSAA
jgi:hypothetical protein